MPRRTDLSAGTRTKWSGKRHVVKAAERVGPTPETAAKLKPWPMRQLYEANKISMNQYEAAQEIVTAFKFIAQQVGFKPLDLGKIGAAHGEIGAYGERCFAVYKRWGNSVQGFVPPDASAAEAQRIKAAALNVRPHLIVELIEDERPIHSGMLKTLCSAINRWDDFADEYDREKQAEKSASARRHTIMIDAME